MSKRNCTLLAVPVEGLEMSLSAKIELVRKFQRIEGNPECYGSAYNRVCGQFECLWHSECLARTQEYAQHGDSHEQST